MKHLAVVGLLLFTPSLASAQNAATNSAPSVPSGPLTVREYAHNQTETDWDLGTGWSWSGGTLTHIGPVNTDAAQLLAMPAMTVGKTYRVNINITGRTQGNVTIALGGGSTKNYGQDGSWTLLPVVSDPDQFLSFQPTADFDGSISNISVVELGDELVDAAGWTMASGWTQNANGLECTFGAAVPLERGLGVVPGHTYRVYFSILGLPQNAPNRERGFVSLGGSPVGSFGQEGDWNYSFDFLVVDNDHLVFTPTDMANPDGVLKMTIANVTVREITSDAPATQAAAGASRR